MTEAEKAHQTLREFDAETNAYCVERGEQRLALVRAYHEAKELAERPAAVAPVVRVKGNDADFAKTE